jgi:predicted lipopolysaccharide heptosyltransferase III
MDTEFKFDRILVSRMKFIGDVVLTTPIIRSLRNAYPGAYIAYLGEKETVSLLENNPTLNEIIPFDFHRPALLEQMRVVRLLRRRKFDLAIDLFGNPRTALLMFLSGARVRVGPDRRGRGALYTVRVRDDGVPKSAVEFHNQSLHAVGIPASAGGTAIYLTAEEREAGRRTLDEYREKNRKDPQPVVGIHPGATWPAKRWLPDRFAGLADALVRRGASVILTAGARDAGTIAEVRSAAQSAHPVLLDLPLRRLAAVIAACDVYVTNDAGPLHIAVAVGTPTIGLFGPGEENIWFPYSTTDGHRALREDVSCHPCHLDFCNRTGNDFMECMKLLALTEVIDAVERVLQRKPFASIR